MSQEFPTVSLDITVQCTDARIKCKTSYFCFGQFCHVSWPCLPFWSTQLDLHAFWETAIFRRQSYSVHSIILSTLSRTVNDHSLRPYIAPTLWNTLLKDIRSFSVTELLPMDQYSKPSFFIPPPHIRLLIVCVCVCACACVSVPRVSVLVCV